MAELEVGQVQREDKSDGLLGSSGGAGCIEDSRAVGPDVILRASQRLTPWRTAGAHIHSFVTCADSKRMWERGVGASKIDSPPARTTGAQFQSCSKPNAVRGRGPAARRTESPARGAQDCGGSFASSPERAGTGPAACAPRVYAVRRMAVAAGDEEALLEAESWLAADRKPAGAQLRRC